MFDTLTPRWGLFLVGCIAILLAPIPFVAFYKGPWIREHSPYSKILMAEEQARVAMEAGMARGDVEVAGGEEAEKARPDPYHRNASDFTGDHKESTRRTRSPVAVS
jgi:hypothetical protein